MVKFKNKKMRSKLNWLILKTLVLEYVTPITIAELFEFFREGYIARGPTGCAKLITGQIRPSNFYLYLYRLADAGFLKIDGLRYQKNLYLTNKGRDAVKTLIEEENFKKTITQNIIPDKKEDAKIEKVVKWIREKLSPHRKYLDAKSVMEFRAIMSKGTGKGPTATFISYDVPEEYNVERQMLSTILKGIGFFRMNESFYIGNAELLKEALESIEDLKVLPYVCWGKLSFMPA